MKTGVAGSETSAAKIMTATRSSNASGIGMQFCNMDMKRLYATTNHMDRVRLIGPNTPSRLLRTGLLSGDARMAKARLTRGDTRTIMGYRRPARKHIAEPLTP